MHFRTETVVQDVCTPPCSTPDQSPGGRRTKSKSKNTAHEIRPEKMGSGYGPSFVGLGNEIYNGEKERNLEKI